MGHKQGELRDSQEPGCLVPRVSLKRALAGGGQSRSGGRVPGRGVGSSGNRGHSRGAQKAKPARRPGCVPSAFRSETETNDLQKEIRKPNRGKATGSRSRQAVKRRSALWGD